MKLEYSVLVIFLGTVVNAYKILIIHPVVSYSHQQPIMVLTEALIQKNHQVTVLSPNAVPGLKNSNYTHLDTSFAYDFLNPSKETDFKLDVQKQFTKWELLALSPELGALIEVQFTCPAVLNFQRRIKDEKLTFDVVIVEAFFFPYSSAMARILAGPKPIISFSTATSDFFAEDALGSISHLSYVPSMYGLFTNKMNLWERIENWVSHHWFYAKMDSIATSMTRTFLRKHYGPEYEVFVDDYLSNLSLSLISSNFLYYYPRLLGPNVVELGPMHLKPPQKLPQLLQEWLDGAEKGVIYMSLGSNVRSNSLPESIKQNFLKFFRESPAGYRVLWKWEDGNQISGQSSNILTKNWLPQQSVLAHPKLRVFITQGGLQSFQESVHYGVPMVSIPWLGDQELNAAKIVDAGVGVRLRPPDLNSYEKLKAAVDAVLYDKKYTQNIKKLSDISHDFTSTAVNKAVFWVEHVARHDGAPHLRPSTADTTYFQYFCLDILSVILGTILIFLYAVIIIFKFFISFLRQSPNLKVKES